MELLGSWNVGILKEKEPCWSWGLGDKDISGTLLELSKIVDVAYLGGLTHRPRGADAETLQSAWHSVTPKKAQVFSTVAEAYQVHCTRQGKGTVFW